MARAKRKPLTGKQQEIVDLMKAQPDIKPPEIADILDMSAGGVYQAISRLRSAGHLPKSSNGRRKSSNGRRSRAVAAPATKHEPGFDGTTPALTENGSTLEEHLASELRDTVARIDEITQSVQTLEAEGHELATRREKLTAAEAALSPS